MGIMFFVWVIWVRKMFYEIEVVGFYVEGGGGVLVVIFVGMVG